MNALAKQQCVLASIAGKYRSRIRPTLHVSRISGSSKPPHFSSTTRTHHRRTTTNVSSGSSLSLDNDGNNFNNGGNNNGSGSGGGGDSSSEGSSDGDNSERNKGIVTLILKGWNDRVAADPQFIFKVATEQVIGVSACVLGDMASRPNFGLNELDFVFCTLVVGSIVNFALMYLLAPTSAAGQVAVALPGIFARSPAGHMFEAGSYSAIERIGTFVYKGVQFATVGFFAGLAGTALSTGLLQVRKKLDPEFTTPNKPPPTVLNAATWAIHMGLSSNFRYQCLNGLDQVIVQAISPNAFRIFSFGIRGANNLIGGSTFVMLAKVTGSQKAASVEEAISEEPRQEI